MVRIFRGQVGPWLNFWGAFGREIRGRRCRALDRINNDLQTEPVLVVVGVSVDEDLDRGAGREFSPAP